jgi:hypothetical protein
MYSNTDPVVLRRQAINWLKYKEAQDWAEAENTKHERQLNAHFAERDAGREPLKPVDLVSVSDGAERVGVKPQQVHHWIRNWEIRVWGIPKHYRVSLAELKQQAENLEDFQ